MLKAQRPLSPHPSKNPPKQMIECLRSSTYRPGQAEESHCVTQYNATPPQHCYGVVVIPGAGRFASYCFHLIGITWSWLNPKRSALPTSCHSAPLKAGSSHSYLNSQHIQPVPLPCVSARPCLRFKSTPGFASLTHGNHAHTHTKRKKDKKERGRK